MEAFKVPREGIQTECGANMRIVGIRGASPGCRAVQFSVNRKNHSAGRGAVRPGRSPSVPTEGVEDRVCGEAVDQSLQVQLEHYATVRGTGTAVLRRSIQLRAVARTRKRDAWAGALA